MNTLVKRIKNVSNPTHRFFLSCKKTFTSGAIAQLDKSGLQQGLNSEVLNRLIQKDEKYFIELSNTKGPEYALSQLESITSSLDSSTKLGREALKVREEIVTRLSYNFRDVEEHENVSNHICEKDLSKVYSEHLKTLQSRMQDLQYLTSKSTEESQLVYEYSTSSAKYTMIPLLSTSLSIALLNIYSNPIVHVLGASSPVVLSLAALYMGLKRMQWLRAGDRLIKGSTLVKRLSFSGNTIKVDDFFKKSYTLSFATSSIQKVDNAARREAYYIIKDSYQKPKFILPVTDNAVVDEKSLGWFTQLKKQNEEYSIRHVLSLGDKKIIDLNKHKSIKQDIETVARINLLTSRGTDLSILSAEEINKQINLVSDAEIQEYLRGVNQTLSSNHPNQSLESNLVSVENLIASMGINREEAVSMTKYLRDNLKINNVRNLVNLTKEELADAYGETVRKSGVDFNTFRKNLKTFFSSLNKI